MLEFSDEVYLLFSIRPSFDEQSGNVSTIDKNVLI